MHDFIEHGRLRDFIISPCVVLIVKVRRLSVCTNHGVLQINKKKLCGFLEKTHYAHNQLKFLHTEFLIIDNYNIMVPYSESAACNSASDGLSPDYTNDWRPSYFTSFISDSG